MFKVRNIPLHFIFYVPCKFDLIECRIDCNSLFCCCCRSIETITVISLVGFLLPVAKFCCFGDDHWYLCNVEL